MRKRNEIERDLHEKPFLEKNILFEILLDIREQLIALREKLK